MRKSYKINTNNKATSGSIGFFGVLQIVFIVLKLADVVNWSWFVVLLPTVIGAALYTLALLIAFIMVLIVYLNNEVMK